MDIKSKDLVSKRFPIEDLDVGTVFESDDTSGMWMIVYSDDDLDPQPDCTFAVDISDGQIQEFENTEEVTIVNGAFVLD